MENKNQLFIIDIENNSAIEQPFCLNENYNSNLNVKTIGEKPKKIDMFQIQTGENDFNVIKDFQLNGQQFILLSYISAYQKNWNIVNCEIETILENIEFALPPNSKVRFCFVPKNADKNSCEKYLLEIKMRDFSIKK